MTEYVGFVPGGATDGGEAGAEPDLAPAACAPDPPPPAVMAPVWNCGERCLADDAFSPTEVPARFTGNPDPAAASRPTLLYPLAESMHPIDLADITFQWRIASGDARAHAYRIRLSPAGEPPYELYVPCRRTTVPIEPGQESCFYSPPRRHWAWIAAATAGRALEITVAASTPLSQSEPASISFSPAALEGGLTYFSAQQKGLRRNVFGAPGTRLLVQPGPAVGGADCVGCHSVSHDGGTIAFAATLAGRLFVARTSDPTRPVLPTPGQTLEAVAPALSRDGRYVLGRAPGGAVSVWDAASGALVTTADTLGGKGLQSPAWSPDGSAIAATLATSEESAYSARDGVLVTISFQGGRLGAPATLVEGPAGEVHLHPSWSPDGKWIAFASVRAPAGGGSYGNRNTRLRLVEVATRKVYELGKATGGPGLSSTSPSFAPARQAGCNVMFIAFSSRIDYGFLRANREAPLGGSPQLWLSAVDLRRLGTGDPSSAPVWLPFQEPGEAAASVSPAWSARVPCADDATCGDGATCRAGACSVSAP